MELIKNPVCTICNICIGIKMSFVSSGLLLLLLWQLSSLKVKLAGTKVFLHCTRMISAKLLNFDEYPTALSPLTHLTSSSQLMSGQCHCLRGFLPQQLSPHLSPDTKWLPQHTNLSQERLNAKCAKFANPKGTLDIAWGAFSSKQLSPYLSQISLTYLSSCMAK